MNLIPILTVIFIVIISLLVTKIAAALLVHTGLSDRTARFQARSAFTGCGYTTSESEQIATHPGRRKVISTLMLLGNAGIVTVMTSLLLTFIHKDEQGLPWYYGIGILVGGMAILTLLASSNKVDQFLNRLTTKVLKRFPNFSRREYSSLYNLADGYHLFDLFVEQGSWLVGKQVSDKEIIVLGFIILGIENPDGTYTGTPATDTVIKQNDLLVVYGNQSQMAALHKKISAKM
ncbi:MAG: TrkA C-terminal domain-containing protein [Bacteroidales bacterium]|nr:TrkA C-terminal domain-containing protein [Bacteroidales bacterium]